MHKFKCFHQIRSISVYRSSFLHLMAWIFITVFKYMSANSVHCACFIVLHADHFKDLFQNQVWARCALLSWHLIYYAASITESKQHLMLLNIFFVDFISTSTSHFTKEGLRFNQWWGENALIASIINAAAFILNAVCDRFSPPDRWWRH